MKFKIFIVIGSLLSAPCLGQASGKIFGGENVVKADPIAEMTVLLGDQGTCTGVLIDKDLVLTAAHCTGLRVVRFGLTEGQSEARNATGCVRHPKYEGPKMAPLRWDIAILKFPGGLPAGFKPSKVLSPKSPLSVGEKAILAGYGRDDVGSTGTLNKAQVTISFLDEYSPMEVVFDQTQGKGACYGDSGGPAWVTRNGELQLIGITNGPYDARDCKGHGVYQRVPAHQEWLARAAKAIREAPAQSAESECVSNIE
jgi:hypothetical protein